MSKGTHTGRAGKMLECRACVLRCIRAVAGDGYATTSSLHRPLVLTPQLANRPRRRRLATAVQHQQHQHASHDALSSLDPLRHPTADITVRSKKGGAIVIRNEAALRQELVMLKDRVKLADHVDYTLRNNQPDKALDLCRLASREMECIVAWNHTISWHMANDKVGKALDIYNEMKKRGQTPDSYTYVRILHGLAGMPEHLSKAVSIYNSMSSPTSKVNPSVTHSNAALNVCALAGDMDALWGIVSRMQQYGANAPDCITYTTILQAIQHQALGDEVDPLFMEKQRQDGVNEGRRIWQEVITKWRAGDLVIDEKLVVAMANLLLTSRRMQDCDDVLSLVQQTTRLARLAPSLDSPERQTGHVPKLRTIEEGSQTESDPITQAIEDPDGFIPIPSHQAFKSVSPMTKDLNHSKRSTSLAWVTPGNGILSVLIRACSTMRIPKAANAYWDVLTEDPFRVRPDKSNFQSILRMHRVNRSSAKAAHTIVRAHNECRVRAEPRTYQIAMEVCARDFKNRNIVEVAGVIIDDMAKHMEYPDVTTLCSFLSIALKANNGPGIVTALTKLHPLAAKMPDRIRVGRRDPRLSPEHLEGLALRDREESLSLFRVMIGTIDTIRQRGLIPTSSHEFWGQKRAMLDKWISEVKFGPKDNRVQVSPLRSQERGLVRVGAGRDKGLRPAVWNGEQRSTTSHGVEERLRLFQRGKGNERSGVKREDRRAVVAMAGKTSPSSGRNLNGEVGFVARQRG